MIPWYEIEFLSLLRLVLLPNHGRIAKAFLDYTYDSFALIDSRPELLETRSLTTSLGTWFGLLIPLVWPKGDGAWPLGRAQGWGLGLFSLVVALFLPMGIRSEIQLRPATVVLVGPEATQQILVHDNSPLLLQQDLTHHVRYLVVNPGVVRVNALGLIEAVGEGKTEILVLGKGPLGKIPVEVRGIKVSAPVSFDQQIIPLLTKATCNSGGCHGKAEGQNGFKLSVFGFDTLADHQSLIAEGRGRRILPSSPENSMLVLKATGRLPHGGGRKIVEGSLAHQRLVRWIREGMHFETAEISPVVGIETEPQERTLPPLTTQQLRVTAKDAKGQTRCVTSEAEYETNEPNIAGVDRLGNIQTGTIPGEAVILVRYMGQVTFCRITVPQKGVTFPRPPEANFVDTHVWNKLGRLGIPPSGPADDATFLRRVYLDTIGTLPTATEARLFLADAGQDKRSRLIDHLLERPEYADFWTLKWADILRVDRDTLTAQGAVVMTRWLGEQFSQNRPYDQFVREIITAKGGITEAGPAGFYKVLEKPENMSRSISQLFLGVRIECAQCHHHPSEKWTQEDYFALAGFFTGVQKKAGPNGEVILAQPGADLKNPATNKSVPVRFLGGNPLVLANHPDRREVLADWMTSADNPFLARAITNRIWSHYLGRGIIEPIDDLRVTNPATNEPLLAALSSHLVKSGFNLKALTKVILQSKVYQLGAQVQGNASDEQNFSHALARPMPAEVLLDAICQVTGVPEKFNGWPEGVRAISMWDNRMPSYFLKIFGRPGRTSVCECERSGEPSIAQALHMMNAPEINAKIHSRRGIARKLADSSATPQVIIEELFFGVLARKPTPSEKKAMIEIFTESMGNRRAAVEDILWALLNTREFVFNH